MASAGTSTTSPRSQERTTSSPRCGSASTSAGGLTRPLAADSAGQRSPSSVSQPSTRSTPPPSGSASMSSVRHPARAAVTARPVANTLAPAPPRPPRTATTCPAGAPSESLRSRVASQLSPAGSATTCSTPSWSASGQSGGPVPACRPTSTSAGRRPSRARRHAAAASIPTSTSGARPYHGRAAAGSGATSMSTPTSAATRTRSSSSSGSAVTTSGWRAGSDVPSWTVRATAVSGSDG